MIGCGPGRIVKGMTQLCDNNYSITAVDGSPGMIERAIANNKDILPEAEGKMWKRPEFIHMNAMDMDYKEEFDVIWTCTVLQHNSDKNKKIFLPRMWDALKPGGLYICVEGVKTERDWVDSGEMVTYKCKGPFAFNWTDEKKAKGTAAWWIDYVGQRGFEILQYGYPHQCFFVWRKIRERGRFEDGNNY